MSINEREIKQAMAMLSLLNDWNNGHVTDDELHVELLADTLQSEIELRFE